MVHIPHSSDQTRNWVLWLFGNLLFTSHIVQIKHLNEVLKKLKKWKFTSHIVQIKPKQVWIGETLISEFTSHIVQIKLTSTLKFANIATAMFTSHIVQIKLYFISIPFNHAFNVHIPHSSDQTHGREVEKPQIHLFTSHIVQIKLITCSKLHSQPRRSHPT